jgi:hypothetical protein
MSVYDSPGQYTVRLLSHAHSQQAVTLGEGAGKLGDFSNTHNLGWGQREKAQTSLCAEQPMTHIHCHRGHFKLLLSSAAAVATACHSLCQVKPAQPGAAGAYTAVHTLCCARRRSTSIVDRSLMHSRPSVLPLNRSATLTVIVKSSPITTQHQQTSLHMTLEYCGPNPAVAARRATHCRRPKRVCTALIQKLPIDLKHDCQTCTTLDL